MENKKVAYYNMPNDITYERKLLEQWNIDNLELINFKGKNIVTDLQGFQGLVTEYTMMPDEVLSQIHDLEIIALQSIGYDEIDVKAARKHNIDVTNAPGYCGEDVATHAMALLLSLTRQITLFQKETHEGVWNPYAGNTMYRLSGKKVGLVSFGNIPQKEVPMLKGFGMDVVSYDPARDESYMNGKGVGYCSTLDELLEQSDIVMLHTPLLRQTYHMMNEKTLKMMKDGAILINVSRGQLVDESALVEALKNGKLRGVGLDVLEDEQSRNTALFNFPNVIITPHVAFLSDDSLKQSREMALKQLVKKLIQNDKLDYLVN